MGIQILLTATLIYFAYALHHHKRRKNLSFLIFVEYLLTAALALVLLAGVTLT